VLSATCGGLADGAPVVAAEEEGVGTVGRLAAATEINQHFSGLGSGDVEGCE